MCGKEPFTDSVDQDQTAQNVYSDLWPTLSDNETPPPQPNNITEQSRTLFKYDLNSIHCHYKA